jgi:hypothetical protein
MLLVKVDFTTHMNKYKQTSMLVLHSYIDIKNSVWFMANDAREGSRLYSNRCDQSGWNSCCTAMWKANGKTTTLLLFLDSLFPTLRKREDIGNWKRKH